MTDWTITDPAGVQYPATTGHLESTLNGLRRMGYDEFIVEAGSIDPGLYVPDLQRHEEIPDVVPEGPPEEWT